MYYRETLIKAAYDAMLAERGLPPQAMVGPGTVVVELWEEAVAEADQTLAAQARDYSDIVWASSLAPFAQALIDGVEAANVAGSNPIIWVSALKERYQQARQELLESLMKEAGQDVCRKCRNVKPSDEIQLVCVYHCFVVGSAVNGQLTEKQYFGRLCEDCRIELPLEQVSIGYPGTTGKLVKTFRSVHPAVLFDGMFWADDNGLDVRVVGEYRCQPEIDLTAAFELTEALATAYGLPPDLTTRGAHGVDLRVVIQMNGYQLPMEPATVAV